MKYQFIHKKDLLNGRTARATPLGAQQAYVQTIPVVRSFEAFTRTSGRIGILHDLEIDRKAAAAFRQFFNVRYLSVEGRFAMDENVKEYLAAVFPDSKLLYQKPHFLVYELPELSDWNEKPDKLTLRFFLYSGWKQRYRELALGLQNQAKLLLPHVKGNQNLFIHMRIRSRNPVAANGGKAVFRLKDKVVAEVDLKKKFLPVVLTLNGKETLNDRSILTIELVDSNYQPLQFREGVSTKFELKIEHFKAHNS